MIEPETVRVRDVMRASPRIVDGLATVREALELMAQDEVNALVIDRRDENDEYGMVTIGDIARDVLAENRAPERVSVYEIMAKPAVTVDAAMNAKYAVRLMTRFGITRALVTEKGAMAGLVSLRDLCLRYAAVPVGD